MQRTTRGELDFPNIAKACFDFLSAAPYAMRIAGEQPLAIQFEGNGVVVWIGHDRLSYELALAVWRPTEAPEIDRPYSMSDLIRVADPLSAQNYRGFAATTTETLRHGLAELASDLRHYGTPALLNDPTFYRRLSSLRKAAVRDFAREMKGGSLRQVAESAWRAGDMSRVVEAYRRIENTLSPAERKRLGYARKKILDRGPTSNDGG